MEQLQRIIYKKENQYNNPAYTLATRKAIEYELNQLKEVNRLFMEREYQTEELFKEIDKYKETIFHFELLTTALLGTSPNFLGTYLNIYSVPLLIAYFKNTTPTMEMCEQLEAEHNLRDTIKQQNQLSSKSKHYVSSQRPVKGSR